MKSYVSEAPTQDLRRRLILFASGVALAAAVVGSMATLARADNGEVLVLRGTTSETKVLPRRAAEGELVSVGRGEPVQLGMGETIESEASLAQLEPLQGAAGWFIDRQTNRLGNCYRVSGTDWGVRRIRCIWKTLP